MRCVDLDYLALHTDSEGKSLKDFIVPVLCSVDAKKVAFRHERFHHFLAQYAETTLDVQCYYLTDTRRIIFQGNVDIQAGDEIIAYIVKVKGDRMPNPRTFVSRDFREEEKAVKIDKYCDGKIVATYLRG